MASPAKKKPAPSTPATKKPAPKKGAPTSKKTKAKAEASPSISVAAPIPETTLIPHNRISPSGLNPRKSVREGYIEELAESLKATGQLQNISVRMHIPAPGQKGDGQYEIIYGEQRWQAFRLLIDRGDLPADHPMLCRVMVVDDAQHLELAILENQAREDVHPLEQAEAYARLAKIRAEETGDNKTATRMIADRTGQTMRNVQFYLQVAGNLSDEAKAAWRNGRIRNRKIAIELARWPHDIQNDAVEDIEEVSDPAELRRWIERDAIPVGHARFPLEDYLAAGGTIVPGEDDRPDRLANKGLAGRLQREWAEAEAARITAAKGYGVKPAAAESSWSVDSDPWAKPTKGTPKTAQGVRYHVNPHTLEVKIKHPLSHVKAAKAATIQAALKDRDGEPPLEDLPQPYSRRNWVNGATARTRFIRQQIIEQEPNVALAIALMGMLPKDGHLQTMCSLRWDHPTGDAGEVSRAAGPCSLHSAIAALHGKPGFTKEGRIDPDNAYAAMQTLLATPLGQLLTIFAELIADHSTDASFTIAPGAKAEARAVMQGALNQGLPGLCTSEWLKAYTAPQIRALAEESGAADAMRAAGKEISASKSLLVSEVPAFIPADYIPPEARVLSREEAEQAVASMLARKPGCSDEGAAP